MGRVLQKLARAVEFLTDALIEVEEGKIRRGMLDIVMRILGDVVM